MDYGTGAIMAVPAHDERDRGSSPERFDLPDQRPSSTTTASSSTRLSSPAMPHEEAAKAIVEWLGTRGRGRPAVSYRLRDWGYSRQRYWGCPIPIVYCDDCGIVPVPEEDLPVAAARGRGLQAEGSPAAGAGRGLGPRSVPAAAARKAAARSRRWTPSSIRRGTSCATATPTTTRRRTTGEMADYWMPVDHYTGGIDHSTVHLIYARYFTKVLNELGLIGSPRAVQALLRQRLRHAGWREDLEARRAAPRHPTSWSRCTVPMRRGSRSCSSAPPTRTWSGLRPESKGCSGSSGRLWRVVGEVADNAPAGGTPGDGPLTRRVHRTIARVTDDLGRRHQFHTPIAAVMELVNELSKSPDDPAARFAAETAVSLLQPYAPHVAEELWERLGHERLWEAPWPEADPALLEDDTFELVVQVNGKVRDRIQVPADLPEDELVARAKESPKVQAHLNGGRSARRSSCRAGSSTSSSASTLSPQRSSRTRDSFRCHDWRHARDPARSAANRRRSDVVAACWCSSLPGKSLLRPAQPAAVAAALRVAPAGRRVSSASATAMFVDVVGAVRRPGLYRLTRRVARRRRGHARGRADAEGADRAASISPPGSPTASRSSCRGAGRSPSPAAGASGRRRGSGPVHLNSAHAREQLDALPGVGPVTAQKILDYRQQHGAFGVRRRARCNLGIGPARLERLRDLVAP